MSRARAALVAAACLAVPVLVLAACGTSTSAPGGPAEGGASSSPTSLPMAGDAATESEADDILFAQGMIPHHRQAVEMADIALANPDASAYVRDLAQRIKDAQQPEIDQMTGWLKQWGAPVPKDHSGHDMGDMEDMASDGMPGMMTSKQMTELKGATGASFNQTWLTMMIAHHQGALAMASNVLRTTSNEQVAMLAKAIIAGQQAEIDSMKAQLTA